MGTPDYALPSLEALSASHHQLEIIWTKQENKAGRGQKIQKSAVSLWAKKNNIACRECKNLRDPEELEIFRSLNLDACIVVSFGIILPKEFLEATKLGCLNLHPSLLPKWRGAAPIERAILAGDKKTGITIMLLAQGIDDGDILFQQEVEIGAMNAGSLKNLTANQGAKLLLSSLELFSEGKIKPRPQNDSEATMAEKISREDRKIDWQKPAQYLLNQIRALSPKPAPYFYYNGKQIKLLEAEIIKKQGRAGEVLDESQAIIACGTDSLKLLTLQREGKNSMPAASFLHGLVPQLKKNQSLN